MDGYKQSTLKRDAVGWTVMTGYKEDGCTKPVGSVELVFPQIEPIHIVIEEVWIDTCNLPSDN